MADDGGRTAGLTFWQVEVIRAFFDMQASRGSLLDRTPLVGDWPTGYNIDHAAELVIGEVLSNIPNRGS